MFTLLGLRSLYMALATLAYLHYGVAAVLACAGLKMLLSRWVEIPPLLSVGAIVMLVGAAVWASLRAQIPYTQSKLREDG
jgi:tellurite resistance protein TerC